MKTTKTVFIEYSTFRKGQHFITVVHVEKGKRQIIGRIFKVYDKENEKYVYYAKDWMSNDVFVDTKELYALKQNFIDCGQTMAMSIPAGPNPKEKDDFPYSEKIGKKQPKEKLSRENELKQVRGKSTEKSKETKVEKEHDEKLENEHDEKYKNEQPDKSEREQVLEQVREQNNGRENDQEVEQEIDR